MIEFQGELMTDKEFDEKVKGLRGKVKPERIKTMPGTRRPKNKRESTPEEWAANLDCVRLNRKPLSPEQQKKANNRGKKWADKNRESINKKGRESYTQNREKESQRKKKARLGKNREQFLEKERKRQEIKKAKRKPHGIDPKEFDRQVAELRGKVKPKPTDHNKMTATPKQWAAFLDYGLILGQKHSESRNAYAKKRYAENSKEIRKRTNEKRLENLEEARRKERAYRKANEDHLKKKRKEYESRPEIKEKIAKRDKAWKAKHKDRRNEQKKERNRKNPEKVRKWKRNYYENGYKKRPLVKLAVTMRTRMNLVLRKYLKDCSIASGVRDLGCSIEELKVHLESQFNSRMTWENWGENWHIDHIYPFAAIPDKNDRPQILATCNWRNLQPLTAKANMSKGDKVTPEAQELFNKLKKEFSKKKAG